MGSRSYLIHEHVIDGHRLGRHVQHDPRSLLYRRAVVSTPKSVVHERVIPVLDQGQLGSCTGNAGTGALGAKPVYDTLPADVQKALDESYAVALYSDATKVDDAPGSYKPDDTGSSGLAIGNVLRSRSLIAGFTAATSAAEMAGVMQSVPVIIGIPWFAGFDSPAGASAMVKVSGAIRGGHEIVVDEFDASTGVFTAVNSWGTGWGDSGRFRFTAATMDQLFAQQADCYGFVPLDQPAPTPAPVPSGSAWPVDADPWLNARHTEKNAVKAQKALVKLRASLTA